MRTLIIIGGGIVLACLWMGAARAHSGGSGRAYSLAMVAFLVVWTAVAGGNLWIGVTEAGYTVWEELPIFLVIVAIPSAAAYALYRWMRVAPNSAE